MRKFLSVIALILAVCICFSACSLWPDVDAPDVPLPSEDGGDTPDTPDDKGDTENPDDKHAEIEKLYEKFEQVLKFYQENHLYDNSKEQILLDTIKNLLTLDPELFDEIMYCLVKSEDMFSNYYSAEDYYAYEHQKEYSGIGVTVKFYDGYTQCSYINPDGPAAKAGVQVGDIVYSVDGEFVAKYESDELVSLVKGEDGSNVEMGFYRPSDKSVYFVTITRAALYTPTVTWQFLTADNGEKYAYVIISDFSGTQTLYEFIDFVNDARSNNVGKVIFDVRNNPGGGLGVCLEFINLCIADKDKTICSAIGKDGTVLQTYKTTGRGNQFDSAVILVNGASISAAELFTIVLQEYGLATVIGTQTFGKAVGQEHFAFDNGDVIALTTFEMQTPNGVRYHGVGVTPDIVVENPKPVVPEYNLAALDESGRELAVFGAENEAVTALRQRLVLLGLLESGTGAYDQSVKAAVEAFQKIMGLSVNGQFDEATFTEMTNLMSVITCITVSTDLQMQVAVEELLSK